MHLGQAGSKAEKLEAYSEVGRLEAWSCAVGRGIKYGSALEGGLVEPKMKGRIALSGTRLSLVRSCFQTLIHLLSAR